MQAGLQASALRSVASDEIYYSLALFPLLQPISTLDVDSCIRSEIDARHRRGEPVVVCTIISTNVTPSHPPSWPSRVPSTKRQFQRQPHSFVSESSQPSQPSSTGAPSQLQLVAADSTDDDIANGGVTPPSSSAASAKRQRLAWDQVKQNLHTCHRNFLIQRIDQLERKRTKQEADLKEMKKQQRASAAANKKLQKQMLQLHVQSNTESNEQILCVAKTTKSGKEGKRFSARGYVALGIRKSLSVTSAVGFPLAALVDVSRQTVTRSETAVWAMLTARSAAFHVAMRRHLRMAAEWYNSRTAHPGPPRQTLPDDTQLVAISDDSIATCSREHLVERDLGLNPDPDSIGGNWICTPLNTTGNARDESFSLSATSFCGDATNTGIWKRNKLQGLLVSTGTMTHGQRIDSQTQFLQAFVFHHTVRLGNTKHVMT